MKALCGHLPAQGQEEEAPDCGHTTSQYLQGYEGHICSASQSGAKAGSVKRGGVACPESAQTWAHSKCSLDPGVGTE